MVADVRTSFPSADGFYRPENYNRRCYGPVRYRTALASSLNIPAVKVLLDAGGPAALHERLRECGLTTLDRPADVYGLGLTLGNCEARLLEITNAYASLARLGEYRPWRVLSTSADLVAPLFAAGAGLADRRYVERQFRAHPGFRHEFRAPFRLSRRLQDRARAPTSAITGRSDSRPSIPSASGWEISMAHRCGKFPVSPARGRFSIRSSIICTRITGTSWYRTPGRNRGAQRPSAHRQMLARQKLMA